jgi:hypothetical protein
MEIFLNKRVMRQIQLSVADAIEDGEIDALRDDLASVFSDSGDFYDFISEIIDEWSGEDVDELMELLETQLADADVELKYTPVETEDSDDSEDEDDEDEDDTDDELIVDDEGVDDDEL